MGCLNAGQTTRHATKNQLILIGSRKIVKQKLIAQGAYGQIWKSLQPDTNEIYALKIIKLQTPQLTAMFEKQVAVLVICYSIKSAMKQKQSKNIVCLIQSAKYVLEQFKIGLILLQFSHMSLYQEIQNKRFTTLQAAKILLQILNGLSELHEDNFYHLDIKPQNIIFCKDTYKICDLGSAIQKKIDFKALDSTKRSLMQEYIESNSTLMYRSPEMIDSYHKVIGAKSDVWMAGVIGYMMIYRQQPFQNQGKLAILTPLKFPTEGLFQKILKKMLIINPLQRIDCKLAIRQIQGIQQALI